MFNLKSIQLKITLMTGILLLITVLLLVSYSAVKLNEEGIKLAISEATGQAAQEAASIQVKIEAALDAARTLSQVLTVIPENRGKIILSRDVVNKMLISVLKENKDFLGVYTAWEPNAFDGKDDDFKKTTGHDDSGRYIPYWVHGESNEIIVEALAGYEDRTKNELGGRAGDYYLIPKEKLREAIIDPYLYKIQGKDTLLTSLVVPIKKGGTFYGIAGIDIGLSFLQELADDLDLYEKSGKMLLLSHKGIIAGITGKSDLVGKHLKNYEKQSSQLENILESIKSKEEMIVFEDDVLRVLVPINIGMTETSWAVMIEIPESKILENANAIMTRQIIIGIILIIIGIVLLWWIGRSISLPLKRTSEILVQIAEQGDFSKRVEVKQQDETGQIGHAINKLMDSLQSAISSLSQVMGEVSKGNLTEKITKQQTGDLKQINDSINQSVEMLSGALIQVKNSSEQVFSGATELTASSQAMASGTTEQAASLEEIASTMNEVSSQAKANNENALQAQSITNETMDVSQKGNAQMQEMLLSMDEINNKSTDISKIIKTIDEIAFQTNLLALNAAVEAARAGKYGKGFAVVAEEVRNLAARSAEAAKSTTDLIENTVSEVGKGVDKAQKTAVILNDIFKGITKANDVVGEIASSSDEQQKGIEEINTGLTQINSVVQENSSVSEETASASQELSAQATQMQQLISRFKLKAGAQTTQSFQEEDRAVEKHFEAPTPVPAQKRPAIPQNLRTTQKKGNSNKMIMLDDDDYGKY